MKNLRRRQQQKQEIMATENYTLNKFFEFFFFKPPTP